MIRIAVSGIAIALLLAVGSVNLASAGASPFSSDSRLDRSVTINEPTETLGNVLRIIGAQCDVPLSAEPGIRNRTMLLLVRERPAKEVLSQLSEALELKWRRLAGDAGYLCSESTAGQSRQRLLHTRWLEGATADLRRQLDQIQDDIKRFPDAGSREAARELDELKDRFEALPAGEERFALEERFFTGALAQRAETRALLQGLKGLPPSATLRVLNGERLLMGSRVGALAMPPEVERALRALTGGPGHGGPLRDESKNAPAREPASAVIDFVSGINHGFLVLQARLAVRAPWGSLSLPHMALTPSRVLYGPPTSEEVPGSLTVERTSLLDSRVVPGVPGPNVVPGKPWTYPGGLTLPIVLELVHRHRLSVAFVGEVGLKSLHGPTRAPGQPRDEVAPQHAARRFLETRALRDGRLDTTLRERLADLAALSDADVHVTASGWVRLRSTVPFLDRPRQIEPSVMHDLFGRQAADEAYAPETAMTAARRLTVAQAEALGAAGLNFLQTKPATHQGVRSLGASWEVWRFVGSLPRETQRTLLAGEALRYQSLTSKEQGAVRTLIEERSRRINTEPLDLMIAPRQLSSLTIRLNPSKGGRRRAFHLELGGERLPLISSDLEAQWESARG